MAIKQNMGKDVAERDFPIATVNENALVNAPSGEIDIKFNQQYANTLTVTTSDKFHDRFREGRR